MLNSHREAPELDDQSLLVLVDLGMAGKRLRKRIGTLLCSNPGALPAGNAVPRAVRALVAAGLASTSPSSGTDGFKVEITDAGLILHRCLMAALRNAKPLLDASAQLNAVCATSDEVPVKL